MSVSLWGAANFCAQEVAHESARSYAALQDKDKATKIGKQRVGKFAYLFIRPEDTQVTLWVQGTTANAQVTVTPKIQHFFFVSMPKIEKKSQATLEDVFRNPQNYL